MDPVVLSVVTPSSPGDVTNTGEGNSSPVTSVSSNVAIGVVNSHVFLLTVKLKVLDKWGKSHYARALLDSGSQANLMTERLCQLLKLKRNDKKVEISGIGQSRRQIAHEVSTVVGSRIQEFSMPMDFLVMSQVTDDQPSLSIPMGNWKPPSSMRLADPEFFLTGPIDIVLGSQYFYDFHLLDGGRLQIRKFDGKLPVFVNTVFGWVAAGESEWKDENAKVSCHLASTETLDSSIERFWIIEELSEKAPRSQEEHDCETHFQHTVSRDKNGRYIVRYPKRIGFHELIGDSKATTMRRFKQLERRLGREPDVRKDYHQFMQEYLDLGHMKLVGTVDDTEKTKAGGD
ncbi:uncharacterized protein LOC134207227 [Armigeres subalbatus]|uniref:uncharacterized protein LOC134207227 n=1 Tax=Armigeres subalbatus TaxID=124917 RepID=UPI002ED6137A